MKFKKSLFAIFLLVMLVVAGCGTSSSGSSTPPSQIFQNVVTLSFLKDLGILTNPIDPIEGFTRFLLLILLFAILFLKEALEKVKNKNWSEEAQEIIAVYGNLVPVLGLIAGVGHAIVRTIYTTLVPYSYQMHEFSQTKPFHQTVSGKVNFAAVRWEVRNVSSYRNDPGFIATSR